MDIKYEVQFHTDWHCGSGLSAGADVDALVIKNSDNLPFVPGKTIKGLVRDAITEIAPAIGLEEKDIYYAFGKENDSSQGGICGVMFFTDATLDEYESRHILSKNLTGFMYRTLASTALEIDGSVKPHSLRKTQVTVPCKLQGEILNVPEEISCKIQMALQYIKRLGQHRNRGLGRCTFTIK